jgi:carboxyl-terminal processing protease
MPTADLTPLGIYLGIADGELVVAGIAPGSWAAETRLARGDRVTQINGRKMDMMPTLAAVADALRTAKDGIHLLDIEPADSEQQPYTLDLPVVAPTVYAEKVFASENGTPVGYARIGSFGPTTPAELDSLINRMKADNVNVRSLVLDLRGNMGGSFLAGVDTAKRLLPAGLIVTTQGQHHKIANQPFSSDSGMTAHDIPVVVLVDAETASAAEVVAAALQFHKRATLVGMQTFGKGAIQSSLRLDSLDEKDGQGRPKANRSGGVRLTIARLVAPHGGPLSGVGVTPDILEAAPDGQLKLAVEKAAELPSTMPRMTP